MERYILLRHKPNGTKVHGWDKADCGWAQIYTTRSTNTDTRRDTTCRRCGTRITFRIEGIVGLAQKGGRPRAVTARILPPETTFEEAIDLASKMNIPLELRDQEKEIIEKMHFEIAALWNTKLGDF